MGSLRPNEELWLGSCVSVAELGDEELQRLGLRRTKAYSYRTDGEGNVYSLEADAVRDGEFDILVRVENYYVARHLLGEVNLSNIEHHGNFPDAKTQNRQGKSGKRTRRSRKNKSNKRGRFPWGREQKFVCGGWKRAEHCGYKYWARTTCDREWCPECGKPNSLYHRQMYYKFVGVMVKMFARSRVLAYMVITCPEELREKWRDPNELREFREYLRRMLKREGIDIALWRWHFAGDRSRRWYPHLNLVFPMGYMDKEKLKRLRRLIERRFGVRVIYYQYTRSIKKVMHWARYISRPTWNLQNEVSPESFKNFKKWGTWGAEKLGLDGEKHLSKRDLEEFWMTFGVLVSVLGGGAVEGGNVEDVDNLVKKFLDLVGKESGEDVVGLVKEASVGGGGLRGRVRRILERVLEIKGYPRLEELAGLLVRRGRCIGCLEKLRWKWGGRKGPLITSDDKVYKLGWGVLVMLDKTYEDEEFWYF
ncbi:MAG: hypothetical protein ACO2OT_03875 [Candidatus Caldipriscus sp.]